MGCTSMNLSEKVANLPLTPGVYLMKDHLGHIIYVGKAKRLKKRVQSYFYDNKGHSPKVKQLVRHIRDLDYIETDTEFEAFLLECRMIKDIKPMYNKKMKNPLAYTYITVRDKRPYAQLDISYEPEEDGQVFGPYTSRSTVERAILGIKESQRILCSSPQAKSSLCLNYSLGLCIGMCGGGEALLKYNEIMQRIIGLLSGKDHSILAEMEKKMEEAAQRFDFETAAKTRDYLTAVHALLQKEAVIGFTGANNNIAVLERIDGFTLKLILIKGSNVLYAGKIAGGQAEAPLAVEIAAAIAGCFESAPALAADTIGRDRIDEAQIIYSHLTHSSDSHLIIPDEWLLPEYSGELQAAVRGLLASCAG